MSSHSPVTLASELPGIVPVERLESGDAAELRRPGSLKMRLSDSFKAQKKQHTAPYQALPVAGPITITEHHTEALDVVEPGEEQPEV